MRPSMPRGYGAAAARLTPDQKVGSSNLSALIQCCAPQGARGCRRLRSCSTLGAGGPYRSSTIFQLQTRKVQAPLGARGPSPRTWPMSPSASTWPPFQVPAAQSPGWCGPAAAEHICRLGPTPLAPRSGWLPLCRRVGILCRPAASSRRSNFLAAGQKTAGDRPAPFGLFAGPAPVELPPSWQRGSTVCLVPGGCHSPCRKASANAVSEDRTHDLRITRPTRCQLRYHRSAWLP